MKIEIVGVKEPMVGGETEGVTVEAVAVQQVVAQGSSESDPRSDTQAWELDRRFGFDE
jgi:hypothetical protein